MLGLISSDEFGQGAPLLHYMLAWDKVARLVLFVQGLYFTWLLTINIRAIVIVGTAAGPVNPPLILLFYFRMGQTFAVPWESSKLYRKFFFYLD